MELRDKSTFSCAVVEIVPLLKPVLGRVLPLMGAVKLDNVQWVFANGEHLFFYSQAP